MNKINKALVLLSLVLPLAVLAQTNTPNIDQRQANQEARIQQGEKSGALTPREANRLERQQQRIDRMENRAKADGVVTNKERAHLQHAENRQNRQIRHEKHDRQHDFNHDAQPDRPRRRQ